MKLVGHFLNIPSVYKVGTKWISYVPLSLSYAVAQFIAHISYIFYRKAVENVKANLSLVFPHATDKKLSDMARRVFCNYGKYIIDYGRFAYENEEVVSESIVSFIGKENLQAAIQMNKGVVLLTAHLGNWELGGIFFGNSNLKTNVVTIQDKDHRIDNIRSSYRARHNVCTITIGESPFSTLEMIKALGNKEIVAMLIDRPHGKLETVTTLFFNKLTIFPKGPFILSRLTGAPIIVAFVVRDEKGYIGIVEKPITVTDENHEQEALEKVVRILESYIMMYPEQWYSFHANLIPLGTEVNENTRV